MKLVFMLFLTIAIVRADIIYFVNGLDESLGWVNTETGQGNSQAATLGNIPNDVVAQENRLYVVNSGYNTLQIIDRAQLSTIDEIELTGAVNAYSCVALDAHRVAVTGLISGTVSIANTQSFIVDTTFWTGIGPQALTIHGNTLYVLNTGVAFPNFGEGVLKRYNAESLEFMDSLRVGVNPQAMEFVDNELHVLCTGNYDNIGGSVHIVDITTMTVDTVLHFGGSPGALSHFNDEMYIAAGGWSGSGYIFHYNTRTRAIFHDSGNPILVGGGASDILARSGGGFAVSCFQANEIQWCSSSGESCESFATSAGPGAMAIVFGTSPADPEPRAMPRNFLTIKAYPNPFNNVLHFSWDTPLQNPATLVVHDVLGRVTASLSVDAGATGSVWTISGGEAASGIFFAKWQNQLLSDPVRIVYVK